MYCQNCGNELQEGASFCSSCGEPVSGATPQKAEPFIQPDYSYQTVPDYKKSRKKSHGCLIAILIVLIGVVVFVVLAFTIGHSVLKDFPDTSSVSEQLTESSEDAASNSKYITLDEFNKIKTGMSYEEVVDIVGSYGKLSSEVNSDGIHIVIVTWYGNGLLGSNANVTFTNNKVTGKAQVGLK